MSNNVAVGSAGSFTRRHQVPCCTIAEFMKNAIPIGLLHLGVDVVARVSKLGNLLSQQFHTVDRVAENDTLIDLQFGEKGVKTVDLLSFFDVCVKLSDTPKRKFVHKIDTVRVGDKLLAESFDCHREGGTEETNLVLLITVVDDLLQYRLELRRKKLVGFVHDDSFDIAEIRYFLRREIENSSRCCHDDVNCVVETHDIVL